MSKNERMVPQSKHRGLFHGGRTYAGQEMAIANDTHAPTAANYSYFLRIFFTSIYFLFLHPTIIAKTISHTVRSSFY